MSFRPTACAAALAIAAFASVGHAGPTPELAKGLTIPELVAGLEAVGYRDFDSVQSDQRRIVVQADGPDGDPVTVKYWPETGRAMVSPRGDTAAETGGAQDAE